MKNQYGTEISWKREEYNPINHGIVIAIRIFTDENGINPMAELAFAFGGTTIIAWNEPAQRKLFKDGINGYTLFFDERCNPTTMCFTNCIRIKYNEHKSNLEEQPNSTNEFTHTMILQCIRDRVNSNGNPVNYRIGDQIGDTIIIDLDTLYFDANGTPYAYGKDPKNMDRYPVNYRLDRFKTITE